jgi:16S rRNA (uracil1498-N3)-methyltransferase
MALETRQRLYCDTPLGSSVALTLGREQSHYLMNVLRYGIGQEVLVFNGKDGEYLATVDAADRKKTVLLCHRQTRPQDPMPNLMLSFAPIKKARLDFIAEKATELGVGLVQPVMTDYTQVSRVNTERMLANAIEAAEQTGRTTVPEILSPRPLMDLLEDWPKNRHIIFCDEDCAGSAQHDFAHQVANVSGDVAIMIGPEGGFSPRERQAIMALDGVVPVSLGRNILRADTAMLAALALWQGFAGDWKES